MKLYVEPMDATVVEARPDGWVRLDNEEWQKPTLQERRAIIYCALKEKEELIELLEFLQGDKD